MTSRTPSIALPFQLVITSPTSKPAFLAGPSGSRSTTKTPRPPPDAGELSCRRSRLRGRRPARNSRKERYAMSRDSTVLPFRQPEAIDDPLSELAREGARRMLAQVLIAEADSFVAMWKDLKLPDGRDRVVP